MAKRGVLKNIAHGLLGTFVSRYNDIGGYWGLGVLRSFAVSNGLEAITIDLLRKTHFDEGFPVRALQEKYQGWLHNSLGKRGIPIDQIDEVQISLRFTTFDEFPIAIRDTRGDPYVCTVRIVARNKTIAVSKIGVCGEHDPTRERRRAN